MSSPEAPKRSEAAEAERRLPSDGAEHSAACNALPRDPAPFRDAGEARPKPPRRRRSPSATAFSDCDDVRDARRETDDTTAA